MEFALFIWLTGVIPSLKVGIVLLSLPIIAYCVVKMIWASCNSDSSYTKEYEPEDYSKAMEVWKFKWVKWPATVIVVLLTSSALLPSQKTMYLMAVAYGSQKMVQSEAADKVVKILNGKLDEYLKEAEDKLKK